MSLTKANDARVEKELNKLYNFSSCGIVTLREWIDKQETLELVESDRMIDYSRSKFNRMNYAEQKIYMNNLLSKKYYWINDVKVSKLIFDYTKNSR